MALHPCPECKREISTDAKACPHCGKKAGQEATRARWNALPKAMRISLIGAGCFFALAMWISSAADKPAPSAAAPAVQAAKATPSGPTKVQPGQWFGFRDREMLERESKLAYTGDKTAWSKLMGQGAASGAIVKLTPGEEVFVEDTAMLAGLVKIRRKGETSGWWTNFEAVK